MGESVTTLIDAGRAALAEFDFPLAVDSFRRACIASGGAVEAALQLLAVLVDDLGSDDEAIDFAATLPLGTRRDPAVRLLLAIAQARRGNWADAESLLFGLDDGRVTEALVLASRAALAGDQHTDARRFWDRARRLDPGDPGVHDLGNLLQEREAALQARQEAELERLVLAGAPEAEVERVAQETLGRWGTSGVARRVLDEQNRHRIEQAMKQAELAAEAAALQNDFLGAAQLLRLAAVPSAEPSRREELVHAARRLEAKAQLRAEEERAFTVAERADGGNWADALPEYLALPALGRNAVRLLTENPPFAWLETLAPHGKREEREAIAAVLALIQARAELPLCPERALEELEGHRRLLRCLPEYRTTLEEARRLTNEQARRAATATLHKAALMLELGECEASEALLQRLDRRQLEPEEAKLFEALDAEAQRRARRQRMERRLAHHEASGDYCEARDVARELRDEAELAEQPAWDATLARLQAALDAEWELSTRQISEDAPWTEHLRGLKRSLHAEPERWFAPDLDAVIIPIEHGEYLTVLVVRFSTARLERVVTLRWRCAEFPEFRVCRTRLQVLGARGERLDIELQAAAASIEHYWESALSEATIPDDVVFCANAELAIVDYRSLDRPRAGSQCALVDVRKQLVRRLLPSGLYFEAQASETRYIIGSSDDHSWVLGTEGKPLRGWVVPDSACAAAEHPSGDGIVLLRNSEEKARLELCELRRGRATRHQAVYEADGEAHCVLAPLRRLSRLYVLFTEEAGLWLGCFGVREGKFEAEWKVPWPHADRAHLLTTAERDRVIVLLVGEPLRLVELGAEAPSLGPVLESKPSVVFPSTDYWTCGEPAVEGSIETMTRELLGKTPWELDEWLQVSESSGLRTEDLLAWFAVASRFSGASLACQLVLDRAIRKRESEPLVRLARADQAAKDERWAEVHRWLAGLSEAELPPASAQHLLHLQLLGALERGDRDAARGLLVRAEAIEGLCRLEGFSELLAPMDARARAVPILAGIATRESGEPGLMALRQALGRASELLQCGEPRRALALLDSVDTRRRAHLQVAVRRAEAWCSLESTGDSDWLGRHLACAEYLDCLHSTWRSDNPLRYAEEAWGDEQLQGVAARAASVVGGRPSASAEGSPPHASAGGEGDSQATNRRWTEQAAPRLGHESVEQRVPALRAVVERLAEAQAKRGDPAEPTFLDESDLARHDPLQRVLDHEAGRRAARNPRGTGVFRECRTLLQHTIYWVAYEQYRRKTFWVDEELAHQLAATRLDIAGAVLRLPYPSCAFVFTDSGALELASELMRLVESETRRTRSGAVTSPGPRVVSAYLRETERDEQSSTLVVDLVLDPLVGEELPTLISRTLAIHAESDLDEVLESHRRDAIERALDPVVASEALQAMLHLVVNAVLYATSAECESRELAPNLHSSRPLPSRRRPRRAEPGIFTGEAVYYLPGKVSIHPPADPTEPDSAASAEPSTTPHRPLCKRFPVRGHWRRPPSTAVDGRLRWVRPHFRGPSMAAVIERQYRLN